MASLEEYLDKTYAKGNRGQDPAAKAPTTPEEYLEKVMQGDALLSMQVGKVEGLGADAGPFMANVPGWLGEVPVLPEPAYELDTDILVIGSGPSGSTAVLRLSEMGRKVMCLEAQTWEEYDAYACDMASYNSKFFMDKGVPEYDLMEIYNEYMRKALGHAHPKLVRDYVTRSGEMMDWVLSHVPQVYIDAYAHPTQYKGNKHFRGETCGQKSFIGMLQWRDNETNNNMWPFMMRMLQKKAVENGAEYHYGCQAIRLLQDENGAVNGCIARDIDNVFFKVNCKKVIMAAGDFGGNPDMLIDLVDQLRNLTWAIGNDRTDPKMITSGGRDGSGIRMCMWAGGTMEAGPRAGQKGLLNEKIEMPFGGVWPTFGGDGRRFMNESMCKFAANGAMDMLAPGQIVCCVTDANWDEYCEYQGYGHENMDRSNDHMMEVVRANMAAYKTGKEGFPVTQFSHYGLDYMTIYAADTLEELGEILGYQGEALQNFLDEIKHYNEMCDAGYDSDWGCDKDYMFPIRKAPFFGSVMTTGTALPTGGLCQNTGICTDGNYRVLNGDKKPIPGLYAIGNTCGQRYGIQYHTPTAGNCCGTAMTNGYVVAECIDN